MGLITVHYRDVNQPNKDINAISVKKPAGTPFDVHSYTKRVPMRPRPYYFCQVAKSVATFTTQPQDVIIFVRAYLQAHLVFKDVDSHKVVASHSLYAREVGKSLDYLKIAQNHLPAGYRLLKPAKKSVAPKNSSIFIPGMDEVIYVKYVQPVHKPSQPHSDVNAAATSQAQPTQITARLYYIDAKDGTKKKVVSIHGAQDQPVDYASYEKRPYLPNGYQFARKGRTSGKFLEPNAEYFIIVKAAAKPQPQKPRRTKVTGRVLYQDVNSHQIKGTKAVTGYAGQSIRQYLNRDSKYIPNGYRFVRSLVNNDQLKNNGIYLVLVKANPKRTTAAKPKTAKFHNNQAQPNHNRPTTVTGQLVYKDIKSGRVVKQTSIKGVQGRPIQIRHYISSDAIPNGYRFKQFGSNDWQMRANGRYCILVEANVQHVKPAQHSAVNHPVHPNHQSPLNHSARSSANSINQNVAKQRINHANSASNVNVQHHRAANGIHQHQQSANNLPQIDHNNHDIGSILMALGTSLSALGKALANENAHRKLRK